jgi:histone H3
VKYNFILYVNLVFRTAVSNRKQAPHVFQEIRQLRDSAGYVIPRLPFGRLIREVLNLYCPADFRITRIALEALQESSEEYLTQLFEDAYRCTLHRQRVTLQPIDLQLARCLRGYREGNLW